MASPDPASPAKKKVGRVEKQLSLEQVWHVVEVKEALCVAKCDIRMNIYEEIMFDTGGNAGLTGLNRPQSERLNKTFQVLKVEWHCKPYIEMEGGLSLTSE